MFRTIAAAASLSAALFTSPIQAQDWTGAYAGGSLSYSEGSNTGSRAGPIVLTWEGDAATGVQGGAFAGHNWSLGSQRIIGVELGVSAGEITGEGPGAAGASTTSITYGTTASLAVRLAYDAGAALPYLSMAINSTEIAATYSAAAGTINRDPTFRTGTTIGAGVDYAVGENRFLRVEASYTQFDDIEFGPTPFPGGGGTLRATTLTDLNISTLRIGYGFRF